MSGRYCEKHEEWAPTGECRWCEPSRFDLKACDDINTFEGIEWPSPSFGEPMTMAILMGPMLAEDKKPMSAIDIQKAINDLWVTLARAEKKP